MFARSWLAVVVVPLVALAANAQSYTIQIKAHPAEGKTFTATETSLMNVKLSLAQDGNVLIDEKKVESEEREYIEKVLLAGDKQPKKFTRTYAKAAKGAEGLLDKLSYAGKTITFERKGDAYEVTGDGVDAKDLDDMAAKVNKDNGHLMFPKKAVKVGDTWPIPKEAFGALLAGLKDGADTDKLKAQGKLVKAYKKDGQQWGTIALDVTVPVRKLGPLTLEKPVAFDLKLTLEAAIDGSTTASKLGGTVAIKGVTETTQNNMTFTLDIAVMGVVNQQQGKEQ
jgi:hypothetical protein